MKKLRLKALSLGAREILSREQLKALTGGYSCQNILDCPLDYWCPDGECHYTGIPNPSFPELVSGTGEYPCRYYGDYPCPCFGQTTCVSSEGACDDYRVAQGCF